MPSTSVQISMASAESAPPTRAPVKSEPPRPSVGGDSGFVGGDESAHHGHFSGFEQRIQVLGDTFLNQRVDGHGFLKLGVGNDDVARVEVSGLNAALKECGGDDAAGDALAVADHQVGDARRQFEDCCETAQDLVERVELLLDQIAERCRVSRRF